MTAVNTADRDLLEAMQSIGPEFSPGYAGMTLRDYFAAKAMRIAATFYDTSEDVRTEAATWCYLMADAMLKARAAATKETP